MASVIGSAIIDFRGDNTQFKKAVSDNIRGLQQNQRALRASQRRQDALNRSVQRGISQIKGLAAAYLSFAGIRGLAAQTQQLSDYGAALVETSARIGINTEQLQLWRRAVEGQGGSIDTADRALGRYIRALTEARNEIRAGRFETGSYSEAFRQLGFTANQVLGDSLENSLLRTADGLSSLSDQTDRAGVAFELFGQRGGAFLNVLQAGRQEVEESLDDFRDLGLLTDQQATKLKELSQAFTDVGNAARTAFGGLLADNADGLIGALNAVAASLAGVIGALPAAGGFGATLGAPYLIQTMLGFLGGAFAAGLNPLKGLGQDIKNIFSVFGERKAAATAAEKAVETLNKTIAKLNLKLTEDMGTITAIMKDPIKSGKTPKEITAIKDSYAETNKSLDEHKKKVEESSKELTRLNQKSVVFGSILTGTGKFALTLGKGFLGILTIMLTGAYWFRDHLMNSANASAQSLGLTMQAVGDTFKEIGGIIHAWAKENFQIDISPLTLFSEALEGATWILVDFADFIGRTLQGTLMTMIALISPTEDMKRFMNNNAGLQTLRDSQLQGVQNRISEINQIAPERLRQERVTNALRDEQLNIHIDLKNLREEHLKTANEDESRVIAFKVDKLTDRLLEVNTELRKWQNWWEMEDRQSYREMTAEMSRLVTQEQDLIKLKQEADKLPTNRFELISYLEQQYHPDNWSGLRDMIENNRREFVRDSAKSPDDFRFNYANNIARRGSFTTGTEAPAGTPPVQGPDLRDPEVFNLLQERWREANDSIAEGSGNMIRDSIYAHIRGVDEVWPQIADSATSTWDAIRQMGIETASDIADAFANTFIWEPFQNMMNDLLDSIANDFFYAAKGASVGEGSGNWASGFNFFGRRAKGGPAYGLTLVGEEGPELVNFTSPGYVHTAAQSRDLMRKGMGGGDIIFAPNIQGGDPDMIAVEIRKAFPEFVEATKTVVASDIMRNSALRSAVRSV